MSSAQSALGSLFCRSARQYRQLVVETHSDHLLDRVRMDIRDRATTLQPEDVSVLFFERDRLGVRIHSLRIDGEGNVLEKRSLNGSIPEPCVLLSAESCSKNSITTGAPRMPAWPACDREGARQI